MTKKQTLGYLLGGIIIFATCFGIFLYAATTIGNIRTDDNKIGATSQERNELLNEILEELQAIRELLEDIKALLQNQSEALA